MDNATLNAIVRPLSSPRYEVDIGLARLQQMLDNFSQDYGGLELEPDFQRGHVWLPAQQQHFIENMMRGIVSTAGLVIQFNCPNWNDSGYSGELPKGLQCLDGLQRITAVKAWFDGKVKPFDLSLEDLKGSLFDPARMTYRFRLAVYDFQTREALLSHYLDLNAGGTPHSEAELARVRDLLASARAATPSRPAFR